MKNISNLILIYSYLLFSIIFTNLFLLDYSLFTDSYSRLLQVLLRDSILFIIIFLIILLILLKKKKLLFKYEIILLSIVFIYILIGKYYNGNVGVSLKLLVTPILAIMFGKYIAYFEYPNQFSLKLLNQLYILFALILSTFMMLEILIDIFTQKYILLEIAHYFFDSKGLRTINGLPISYINSMINFYRISSFAFDPVSVSFFFIYPTVYCFYNKRYILSLIFLISVIASFSVIAIYIVGVSLFSILLYRRKLKRALYLLFFIFLVFFFGLLIGWIFFGFYVSSFIGHYISLTIGFSKFSDTIFGLGIGGSGYGSSLNPLVASVKGNGDSLVGVFLSDFGIFGIFFYYYHIKQFKNSLNSKQFLYYTYPVEIVYLNLILWSMLSSATFLLNATVPLLVIIGYLSYKNKIIEKNPIINSLNKR